MAEGSKPVVRAFAILELLVGHCMDGLSNSEIAEKLGLSRPAVSRDLAALVDAGLAEQLPSGRYTASPRFAGLCQAYQLGMSTAADRLDRFQRRAEARAMQLLPSNRY